MNAGFEANVGTDPGPRKKSGLKMGKIHQTNACPKSGYLLSMSINHQNILYLYILELCEVDVLSFEIPRDAYRQSMER